MSRPTSEASKRNTVATVKELVQEYVTSGFILFKYVLTTKYIALAVALKM